MRAARLISAVAASLLIVTASAFAEGFRVASVDVTKVLNESKEAQSKKAKLDEMSAAAKKKLDTKRSAIKDLEKKIKSPDEDSKEGEEFRAQARDFERLARDAQEDLRKEFMRSNKELTEKTLALVKKYAEAQKFDLVFDRSEGSRGPVLYSGGMTDITPQIIVEMNR